MHGWPGFACGCRRSWNDPDALIGSSEGTAVHLTQKQSRAQMSLWSTMAAPLEIGSNILNLSDYDLETYKNTEVYVRSDANGTQYVRCCACLPARLPACLTLFKPHLALTLTLTYLLFLVRNQQSIVCCVFVTYLGVLTRASPKPTTYPGDAAGLR